MKNTLGVIALTKNLEIVKSNSSDLKKIGQWAGWFCDMGKTLVCLSQHYDKITFSECGNKGTTCTQPQCWCGADIEIPKAINQNTLDLFRHTFKNYNTDIKPWNTKDEIIAVAAADLLLGNTIHFDWTTLKKCNYDCSYCPPGTHDNYSPYPSFLECKNYFENAINIHSIDLKKYQQVRVTLTGGEPTIMKEFDQLIEWIKDFAEPNIVTNGTAPIEDLITWHEHSRYLITMHHEYNSNKKTKKIIEFLNTTPYRNFVGFKYFVEDDSYKELFNILHNNPKFLNWTKLRLYPLVDKSTPSRILLKNKND